MASILYVPLYFPYSFYCSTLFSLILLLTDQTSPLILNPAIVSNNMCISLFFPGLLDGSEAREFALLNTRQAVCTNALLYSIELLLTSKRAHYPFYSSSCPWPRNLNERVGTRWQVCSR